MDTGDDAPPPRGLSKTDAAAYCGCDSISAFDDWIRRGIVPGPIPGTHKWDRKAIDRALDKLSGISPQSDTTVALDDWMAKRANRARASQGH